MVSSYGLADVARLVVFVGQTAPDLSLKG